MKPYELKRSEAGRWSIRCSKCGRESFHPKDILERYCGACHVFHPDDEPRDPVIERSLAFELGEVHRDPIAWLGPPGEHEQHTIVSGPCQNCGRMVVCYLPTRVGEGGGPLEPLLFFCGQSCPGSVD